MSTKYDRLLQEVKDFKTVHGHCKITTKTCPDNDELVAFRKDVRRNYTKYVNNETQKYAYCRLNHSRVEELEHIGIIDSESFQVTFEQRIEQLRAFQEEHGHQIIPQDYALNGLGKWASHMREAARQFRLGVRGYQSSSLCDGERYAALESIGFEFGKLDYQPIGHGSGLSRNELQKERKMMGRNARADAQKEEFSTRLASASTSTDITTMIKPSQYMAKNAEAITNPITGDLHQDFDHLKSRPFNCLGHSSLVPWEGFQVDPRDGEKKLLPYKSLSASSRAKVNHTHDPRSYPRDGMPVCVYAHADAFSVTDWAAFHWQSAHKAKIKDSPPNPNDPSSVLLTVDLYFWFPFKREFHKFWQLKGRSGRVWSNHDMIAKCTDPSMPTGLLQLVFSVPANRVNFKSTDLNFSKRLSAQWKFLDGNPENELNLPFDDDRIVANGWGIFTREVHDKLEKEGFFRSHALSFARAGVAAVSICKCIIYVATLGH